MPEPDFDQIARELVDRQPPRDWMSESDIAEQLRQVWNARGAADVQAVAAERASDAAVGWIATVIREQDR